MAYRVGGIKGGHYVMCSLETPSSKLKGGKATTTTFSMVTGYIDEGSLVDSQNHESE